MSAVGDKIKGLRKQAGLTQKNLAKMAGLAEITIRKYENQDRLPKIEQIRKIATALNVDPFEILGPDYFSQTHAALEERLRKDGVFEKYLESIGYSVTYEKVGESESGDYEEQVLNGEVVDRIWIPDEEYFNTIIGKAGVETEFTEEEFKAFQAEIEQSIEYQLWKKNQSR